MKCIYRKEIKYKVFSNADQRFFLTTKEKAVCISVEFADCHGSDCPMYQGGKCLKVLKELAEKDAADA